MKVFNNGEEPESKYVVSLTQQEYDNLSGYTAMNSDKEKLAITKTTDAKLEVHFKTPLASKMSTAIKISLYILHQQIPKPDKIKQEEEQYLEYTGNAVLLSPYFTETQETEIEINDDDTLLRYTSLNGSNKEESSVVYGPYENVAPMTTETIRILFSSSTLLLVATNFVREYEVSHWGNLALEDNYKDLVNQGAKLDGPFSRLKYMYNPGASKNSISKFITELPSHAHDFYYRDEVGNISTSQYQRTEKVTYLSFVPRYMLFGGWKTAFYYGCNFPLGEFLKHSGSTYRLTVPFNPVIPNVVFDKVTVRIVLPEGASDVKVISAPSDYTRLPDERRKTYVDTFGRLVVTLEARNVIGASRKYIELEYQFPSHMLLHEPALLIGAFLALFAVAIAFAHINLKIGTEEDKIAQAAKKHIHEVIDAHDNLNELYREMGNEPKCTATELHHKYDQRQNELIGTMRKAINQLSNKDSEEAKKTCTRLLKCEEARYVQQIAAISSTTSQNSGSKKHREFSENTLDEINVECDNLVTELEEY